MRFRVPRSFGSVPVPPYTRRLGLGPLNSCSTLSVCLSSHFPPFSDDFAQGFSVRVVLKSGRMRKYFVSKNTPTSDDIHFPPVLSLR